MQGNALWIIGLFTLTTWLLYNIWILKGEAICSSLLWEWKIKRCHMLFDEFHGQPVKTIFLQFQVFFFSFLWFLITNRVYVKCCYTSYLYLRLFVREKISFQYLLLLFSLVTPSESNGRVCVQRWAVGFLNYCFYILIAS